MKKNLKIMRSKIHFIKNIILTLIFMSCMQFAISSEHESSRSQKIIDGCWEISQHKLDTGISSKMMSGMSKTINCLETAIIENMLVLVGDDRREDITARVKEFSRATGNLNYPIDNERIDCTPSCGSMYRVTNMGVIADHLSSMLENVINAREELGL